MDFPRGRKDCNSARVCVQVEMSPSGAYQRSKGVRFRATSAGRTGVCLTSRTGLPKVRIEAWRAAAVWNARDGVDKPS